MPNKCQIIDEGFITNTSDHLPIFSSFTLPIPKVDTPTENIIWTAWHKVNDAQLQTYQNAITNALGNVDNIEINNIEQLNCTDAMITDCLIACAQRTLPTKNIQHTYKTILD